MQLGASGILSKRVISLLGACVINFSLSLVLIWGNINLYILSYFHHRGATITQTTNPTILLFTVLPMILGTLYSTKLSNLFGYEIVIRASACIFFISPLVSQFLPSFGVFVICCLVIPATCFSVITVPLLSCMWEYFPLSRSKVTALLVVVYAVGSLVWNILTMHMMNPHNQKASIKQGDMSFFGTGVTENVPKTVFVGFLITGLLTLFGSLLLRKKEAPSVEGQLNEEMKESAKPNDQPVENTKSDEQLLPAPTKEEVKDAMKDARFIIIFSVSFLISLYEIYLNISFKIIFLPIVNDDHFLSYVSVLCNVVSIAGAFFWGWLGDKRGTAFSILVLCIADFGTKLFGNFAMEKSTILVMMVLIGCLSKAIATLAGPGFAEYFGHKVGTELLPYKGVAILAGFILVPLLQVILSPFFTPHQYLVILSSFSLLTLGMGVRLYQINKGSQKPAQQSA